MPTLPISAVSVDKHNPSSRFGFSDVVNTTYSVRPTSITDTSSLKGIGAVYHADQNGYGVDLSFDTTYTKPVSHNVPFSFGDDLHPISLAGNLDSLSIPKPTFENTATALVPKGIIPLESSDQHRIWIHTPGTVGGGAIDFKFELPYPPITALNVPLYFGDGLVTAGVGLGYSSSNVGFIEDIDVAATISTTSIEESNVGIPRLGDQPSTDFNFIDPYDKYISLNLPFYFGDLIVVAGVSANSNNSDSVVTTTHIVENTASGLYPVSTLSQTKFGSAAVYDKAANGYGLNFSFVQSYSPGSKTGQFPPSLNVPFYFSPEQLVQPSSITLLQFGNHDLGLNYKHISPISIYSGNEFGLPTIENAEEIYEEQYLSFIGKESESAISENALIAYRVRHIEVLPEQAIPSEAFGDAWASFYIRYATIDEGIVHWEYTYDQTGEVRVSTGIQPIDLNTLEDGIEHLTPQIGAGTKVHRNERYLHDLTVHTGEYTEYGQLHRVSNLNRRLNLPATISEIDKIGVPDIYLSTQYIQQIWVEDIPGNYSEQNKFPRLGENGYIQNIDKVIKPSTIEISSYFLWGTPRITNNAVLLGPTPIHEPAVYEFRDSGLLIAYAERTLEAQGIDSLTFKSSTLLPSVNNAAKVIAPGSIEQSIVKKALIFDPAQTMKPRAIVPESDPVPQRISFYYRTLDLTDKSILATQHRDFGEAWISILHRNIEPVWDNTTVFGDGYYEEHFTVLAPHGFTYHNKTGTPTVRNVTPQIYAHPIQYPDYQVNASLVSYRVRTITLNFTHSIAPNPKISTGTAIENRNRVKHMQGFDSAELSDGHLVYLGFVPTDYDQFIRPESFEQTQPSYPPGTPEPDKNRFTDIDVRHPTLYPEAIEDSARFGNSDIWSNGIIVDSWDYPDSTYRFGYPLFPEDYDMIVTGIEPDRFQVGIPRISPNWIYCTDLFDGRDYSKEWSYVSRLFDWPDNKASLEARFGTPRVGGLEVNDPISNAGRIGPLSIVPNGIVITNKIRTIKQSITQFSSRFGYPIFPHKKRLFPVEFSSSNVSYDHTFYQEYIPPPVVDQHIGPSGAKDNYFGITHIELLNRQIYPQTFESDEFGCDKSHNTYDDNGYHIGSKLGYNPPMVHFPRHIYPQGFESFTFDEEENVIGHYIRSIYTEGFDSFTDEYTSEFFNGRMKVYNKEKIDTFIPLEELKDHVVGAGIDSQEISNPNIRLQQQRITAYQIPSLKCIGGHMSVTIQE